MCEKTLILGKPLFQGLVPIWHLSFGFLVLNPHHFVPHGCIGDSVAIIHGDLFTSPHVPESNHAMYEPKSGVIKQIKFGVWVEGMANL